MLLNVNGQIFPVTPWLPYLGTPWHQYVKYQECCTGECPQKDHLAGGTAVMRKGRECRERKSFKASCSEDQTDLCSCPGNAGWTRKHWPAFTVWELLENRPLWWRAGSCKSTIAGAPFADPAAFFPPIKDSLHLKASGELLLFNFLQYMW